MGTKFFGLFIPIDPVTITISSHINGKMYKNRSFDLYLTLCPGAFE
jgi:hypothetical protein